MQLSDSTAPDRLSLSGFLRILYSHAEHGFIYAPTLDRETGEFTQVFVRVGNYEKLEQHIIDSSKTTDVYLAPAVFSEPRVSKQTFQSAQVVWTEFDGVEPEYLIEPNILIQSSSASHTHAYWLLDDPVTDYFILESVNRGIAYTLGADSSAFDCTQILRPPGTYNYKRDLPVGLLKFDAAEHNLGDFINHHAPPQLDEDSIQLGQVPDVMDVIYKYAFPEDFRTLFSSKPAEGSRSTYMMRVAYMAAEVGATNEELYAVILNFDDRIRKYTNRVDRHRRLLDIIERARVKYPIATESDLNGDLDPIEVLDVISFGNQTIEVSWLIPDLLQEAGNLLLVGPPGVGKTQVALNFAYGLATGTDLLDFKMGAPKRILFVSCEMGPADLKYFTDKITSQYDDESKALLSENLYVFPHGEPLYLNSPIGQEQLLRMIDVLKVDGFIFDSLGSATSKSLTDEEATKGLLDFNDRLRKNLGVFSWFIHHNRKATETNKEPSGLADVYGSQYITARATTVLSLWPAGHGLLKVRELKKRLAPQEEDWYIKRTGKNLRFIHATSSEKESIVSAASTSKIGKAVNNYFNM